jgi:hypothetical protein
LEITAHWLNAERPIPTHRLYDVLHRRADFLGIRRAKNGKRRLLSDCVIEIFPGAWLESIYPGLRDKIPYDFYRVLDVVIQTGVSSCRSESYAIALATLFDSSEEALNDIEHSMTFPNSKCISNWNYVPGFWRSEEFFRLYIKGRGNARQIAKETGRNKNHVKVMMKAVGLPGVGNFGEATLRACLEVAAGTGIQEACAKSGGNRRRVEGLVPFLSDRLVSAIKAILSKQNGSVATPYRVKAEPVM